MLSRVRIDNFCSLSSLEFRPPPVAVLTGGNGSGKSSLWVALARLQDLILRDATADSCFPRHSRTAWDTREVQRFELDFATDSGLFEYALEIRHTEERDRLVTRVNKESVSLDGVQLYAADAGDVQLFGDSPSPEPRTRFPFGSHRSFLASLEPRPDNKKLQAFKACVTAMWLLRPNPHEMDAISKDEELWLSRDGSNFSSWYRGVTGYRNELIEEMSRVLGQLWPGYRLRFGSITKQTKELQVELQADGRAYKLLFNHLSEGQRILTLLHAVVLYTLGDEDPAKPAPFLFFDEPENYVALAEIQPWLQLLSGRVRERGARALIISHHPEVIDYLAAEDAFVATRPGGGATRFDSLKVDGASGQSASQAVIDASDEAKNAGP